MTPAAPPGSARIRRAEPVMGTVVSMDVNRGAVGAADVYAALATARAVLHKADAVFSTWKEHSPMSRLRRGEIGVAEAPPEMEEVLEACLLARDLSGGWFDPWAMPGGVDPTGLVKGWAAERAMQAVAATGVEGVMVSAGGDVVVSGRPGPDLPWRIGIQNPFDRATILGVVEPEAAVATSGTYERGLHVIDPHTGLPATAAVSASVTGPRLDLVDALATGLLAGGVAALACIEAAAGYEAMLIGADGSTASTSGFVMAGGGDAGPLPVTPG